jgi:NAD(P)H dehydrogenase (quinone)
VTGPTGDGPDAAALEAASYQGRRLAQITIRLLASSGADAATGDGNARATGAAKASQAAQAAG